MSDLYSLAVFLPSLGVGIRRLHDTNRTGWWYLLVFIPVIGWIVLIVFLAMASDPGSNNYGPNPQNPDPGPAAELRSADRRAPVPGTAVRSADRSAAGATVRPP